MEGPNRGGWNGGVSGVRGILWGDDENGDGQPNYASGGGGATDIRINSNNYQSRVIVAPSGSGGGGMKANLVELRVDLLGFHMEIVFAQIEPTQKQEKLVNILMVMLLTVMTVQQHHNLVVVEVIVAVIILKVIVKFTHVLLVDLIMLKNVHSLMMKKFVSLMYK